MKNRAKKTQAPRTHTLPPRPNLKKMRELTEGTIAHEAVALFAETLAGASYYHTADVAAQIAARERRIVAFLSGKQKHSPRAVEFIRVFVVLVAGATNSEHPEIRAISRDLQAFLHPFFCMNEGILEESEFPILEIETSEA